MLFLMNLFDAIIPSVRETEKVFISSYEYHGVRLNDDSWNLSISSINVDKIILVTTFDWQSSRLIQAAAIFRTLSMIKLT